MRLEVAELIAQISEIVATGELDDHKTTELVRRLGRIYELTCNAEEYIAQLQAKELKGAENGLRSNYL